jgi:hypothetical protein
MATDAQIKANQENAQKSSGPTSNESKKKSSLDAVTQGIFSNIAILPGEDEAFIQRLREDTFKFYSSNRNKKNYSLELITFQALRHISFKSFFARQPNKVLALSADA